jgi:hypothetical protein
LAFFGFCHVLPNATLGSVAFALSAINFALCIDYGCTAIYSDSQRYNRLL